MWSRRTSFHAFSLKTWFNSGFMFPGNTLRSGFTVNPRNTGHLGALISMTLQL
jgi:hypothetical protein